MSPAAVLERSIREAEAAELLAVIHANIAPGEAFTREHPAISEYFDSRGLTGSPGAGIAFNSLARSGHIEHAPIVTEAARAAAKGRLLRVWRWAGQEKP